MENGVGSTREAWEMDAWTWRNLLQRVLHAKRIEKNLPKFVEDRGADASTGKPWSPVDWHLKVAAAIILKEEKTYWYFHSVKKDRGKNEW